MKTKSQVTRGRLIRRDIGMYQDIQETLRNLRDLIREEKTPLVVENSDQYQKIMGSISVLTDTLECFICELESTLEIESEDPMAETDEEGCPRRWP